MPLLHQTLGSWRYWIALGALSVLPVYSQIELRVSVKFILDKNGNRATTGDLVTDQDIVDQITRGNEVLRNTHRGYQLRLLPILDVENAGEWFDIHAKIDGNDTDETADGEELRAKIQESIDRGVNKFKWRDDAINFYIVGSNTSASCRCYLDDPLDGDYILSSQNIDGETFTHEIGHYFGLLHTHSGSSERFLDGTPCDKDCDCPVYVPGSDGMADTLADHQCWKSMDTMSWHIFGRPFENLGAADRVLVTNTFYNIMSYHSVTDRFTNDQMDKLTDWANNDRHQVASGTTWFVDRTAGGISHNGSLEKPFKEIRDALKEARSTDVVLLRAGTYTDTTRLDQRVTLRATRGNALLKTL